jgi:hypothetical protein
MQTYGGVELQLHALLTSTPDRGEGSASCYGRFTLEGKAHKRQWDIMEKKKFLSLPGIEP